jgi:cytochrome c oxidase assembly protein subunit 15
VTLAQGAVGYVQYLTGLPIAVVAVHLLGACLLTISVTATVLRMTGTPGGVRRRRRPPSERTPA